MNFHRLIRGSLLGAIALLVAPVLVQAEEPKPLPYLDQLPELVDRDLFFGDPEISGAQLSPDGAWLTFMRPFEGVRNIWIKAIDEPFSDARPLTRDDRPVPGYFWSRDSRFVLYVQDRDGNEDFHVWAVDPAGEVDAETGTPAARNLTDLEGVRAMIIAVPENTPDRMLVGLNDRDPALHDVYALTISTGERELLIENNQNVAGWTADLEGNVRLASRQTPDGGTEILRVSDGSLGEVLFACSWQESCGPMSFQPDGQTVWFMSNRGEDVDLIGLYTLDVSTGELEFFERDPEGEVDFGGAVISPATRELQATVYVGDKPRIYPKTEAFAQALDFLRETLPEGEIGISSQTQDESLALISLSRDVDPATVYLFDRKAGTVEELYRVRPEIDSAQMAEMQPIRYTARDGMEIPGYLTLPQGVEPKNLAVVALIHGGPWARDTWGFRSQVQFMANRGYAVFQPNFRASTGFGKEFLNAGNEEWGDAMQDDITDGIQYLIDQGIADPERICIMGGSYGGYATLAGMVFTPDLYACGVNIVGVSNIISLLNSIPAYWGPIRQMLTLRVGDPETEEGRAKLERQSPINHVDQIRNPLLIVHGANDPRVKQAEADQIVVAMREAGLPVEYILAPDEGHGFSQRINRTAMYARIEQFLAQHLGGRYQADMPGEIAERLAAITVDVATVEMPEVAGELDAARTLPLPTVEPAQLAKGEFSYETTISLGGQEMQIGAQRLIELGEQDDEPVLRIRSTSQTPMGEVSDALVLQSETLRPVSRSVNQAGATIDVSFESREVTGAIEAGGQTIPINIELDAPIFAGESGLEAVLASLPLAEGYRTSLRVAEIGAQQRVRFFSVNVEGREMIEVPAGQFSAWRVTVSALDGEGGDQTVWLDESAPRTTLKVDGRLPPQMGGAAYTTVLTERP
ncbi:MAG: alpha/beta fold hydrolase [Wenzhouxiangella sp.]|jgi:dipeptidyl aminopeptidase/acylaminoacyl peptidase|nr:alpha/beta fold hydrolase [Wenzhouxiangella sp.]